VIGDIPGLRSEERSTRGAGNEAERPLNYAEAGALLDVLGRRLDGIRPPARQHLETALPQIRDAYTSMQVELDRLTADLDEARCSLHAADAHTMSGRQPGDGHVTLGPPADDGRRFDPSKIDEAYDCLRSLGDLIYRTGSPRAVESFERIELCYLSLETDIQRLRNELADARRSVAARAARHTPRLAREPGLSEPAVADGFGLTAEQVAHFERHGYLGPLTLCSEEEMGRIRRWIDRSAFMHRASPIYGTASPRGSAEARDWHLVLPEIHELCTHPGLVLVMEALLGPDLLLWRSQFMRKESGGAALGWHQDGSFPGQTVVPAVSPMKTISAWIAVDEASVDNGCVWVIPDTHKETLDYVRRDVDRGQGLFGRGFEIDYVVSSDRAIPMALKPGQFMVFDCQTLHGSSHNPSPWRRLGLAVRYTSTDVKVYENQTVDGQGYPLDRFGCLVVRGEDRCGQNVIVQPPSRRTT
jgi:chlorinating enzyme